MQTSDNFVAGSTLVQSFWRGDQGWYRTVPVVNGQIQWDAASAWSGPILLSNLPGSGSMQAQGDFVIGSVLWQTFWRGEQGWTRTVPIVNGQVMWEAASNWSTTQSIAFWRGGDREGGQRRSVNAGAGPREHAATTASENTTVVATPGDGTTKYYYLGGQRVAMNQNGTVYYLHGDHLGSTNVVSGAAISRQTYYAYGLPRTTEGTLPTDYAFTGQRQDSYINLIQMGFRQYDLALGRFIQPDTIIPDPYNPQSLNRYSYVLNNPLKYTDPSGHDPLDDKWMEAFRNEHGGREPGWEDVSIRLFSIAFPDEWDPSNFYDDNGDYKPGSIERVSRERVPSDRNWTAVPDALEKLAHWYGQGEERLFTRDIGTLFGGLGDRIHEPDAWATVSDEHNPIHAWVSVGKGNLPEYLFGVDSDSNIHHWGWAVTMGGEYGPGGSIINTGREILRFEGNWSNGFADVCMGNLGAAYGFNLRVMGTEPIHMGQVWNRYMLNQWW